MIDQRIYRMFWQLLTCCLSLGFVFVVGGESRADELRTQGDTLTNVWTGQAEEVRQLILKTAALPGGGTVKPLADGPVLVWVERCFYGSDNAYSSEETRYAVLRVLVANRTDAEIRIKREKITLQAAGKDFSIGARLTLLRNVPLQIDWHDAGHVRAQSQLRTPQTLKIAPGKASAFWCLFAGFDSIPELPELRLKIVPETGAPLELDLNAQQKARLGLSILRLGPGGALALLTVHGQLNRINAGAMAKEIITIVEQGGSRFLVQWAPEARPSDDVLFNWLIASSHRAEQDNPLQQQLPALPATRQFLLAELPQENLDVEEWNGLGIAIYKTSREAAVFALKEIYEQIDPRIALQEIKTGHPWSKIAALEYAGPRLHPDALPDLLALSESSDPSVQTAAVMALGAQKNSAAQEALEKLIFHADPELAKTAFSSLLQTATPQGRQTASRLLKEKKINIPRSELLPLLADYYHPAWLPEIVDSIHDPQPAVRSQALAVLHRIGHPQLIEFCRAGLKDSDESVRQQAFQILVDQSDRSGEQSAREYALKRLEEGHIDDAILQFVERIRETRATPALVAALKDPNADRNRLIEVIGVIGTDQHLKQVLEMVPEFDDEERMATLLLSSRMSVPERLKLVRTVLETSQTTVAYTAIEILKSIGNDEALDILDSMLKKRTSQELVDVTCVALGEIGTSAAVQRLRQLRKQADQAGNNHQFNAAMQGLKIWRSRLPGLNFIESGYIHLNGNDDEKAIKAFSMAILINPELPDAFASRGNIYLRKGDFKKAGKDFDRAIALDEYDGQAITGVAIVKAIHGDWQNAVRMVDEKAPRFSSDRFYAYNTACVYSRTVEALKKQEPDEERDQHILEFEKRALSKLKTAVNDGFQDFDWMGRDPDLASIRDLPEFKKLLSRE